MQIRIIVVLLIVLIVCSCAKQTSNNGLKIKDGPNQHLKLKTGLRIENGINRGLSYTDSFGTPYNLRYIPITIKNDSTITIHVQIAFSNEYDYPAAYGNEQFKVFPFPKNLSPDAITYDTSSYELGDNELRDFLESGLDTSYILNATIEPREECILTLGTLYPMSPKVSGILPNALFIHSDRGLFPSCDWHLNEDPSSNSQIAIGLRLNLDEGCIIIPCGQITYPEH